MRPQEDQRGIEDNQEPSPSPAHINLTFYSGNVRFDAADQTIIDQ
jgi:hypothetical protein